MSASSKKKLRKEQESAKLTERQVAAQKEAKKTKIYTIAFIAVLVALLVIAIVVGANQTIRSSGIREKNTVAMTVGDHEINSVEMNYFYIDAVNNYYNNYGTYATLFGLDVATPLNEQVTNEETGATWADDFLANAQDSAKASYALYDAAQTAGYTLSQSDMTALDNNMNTLELYAQMYGYGDTDAYLKAMYGNGASSKSYRAYTELVTLAASYQNHYAESLTYDDAALRAVDSENYEQYSSFNFNSYYLAASRFLEGGTAAEDGTTTYSDEEKAASVTAAEAAAQSLMDAEISSPADLDAAIAALPINDGTGASTAYTNTLYTSVSATYSDWVTDSSRKEGDMTVIPNTTTAEDGTVTVGGYYVLYFVGSTDNEFPLKNVRHILVSFEGGTTDANTGVTTYSDEEKAAAKASAEELLAQWEAGEATEESFGILANEKSSDGDGTTGGLYENIYPGQMVVNFNDWCFAEGRKAGDTGIVETEYGCHVMYFSGDSEISYRDYLITNELRNADMETWYTGLLDAATVTEGDTSFVRKDLVLSSGN